jgi:FkbM family methyltransferase
MTHSDAQVVALEPDPRNAALARLNTAAWPNCEVIEAAAWVESGELSFLAEPGREAGSRVHPEGRLTVSAISLNELAERTFAPDFVKTERGGSGAQTVEQGHRMAPICQRDPGGMPR